MTLTQEEERAAPFMPGAGAEIGGPGVRRLLAWVVVAAVLVVHVPAFLCMGLDSDVSMWDLCARNVLQGGVAYRDAVENNFPGMLWLHVGLRSLAGWSAAAIRIADLAVLAGIVVLLLRWLPAGGALRPVTAILLLSFYLSTSEWCHCQRDTWMLLPALLALELRRRQLARLSDGANRSLFGWAFVEGMCWAAGLWIKPFVAVPALLCWLVSVAVARSGAPQRRGLTIDLAGLLAGGLTAGVAGIAWLCCTGAWPAFVTIVFDWNRAYAADGYAPERLAWLAGVLVRLLPGSLVHLLALPVALEQLGQALAGRRPRLALLAALYVGWMVQAFWLQQAFDYVHGPAVLLGLTLVAARWPTLEAPSVRWSLAAFAVVFLVVNQTPLTKQRLGLWSRCWREGGSAELRDRLALNDRNGWQELEQVADFLRREGVKDGEVTCYPVRTLPLYLMLDCKPSTRFYALESWLVIFRPQRSLIRGELAASRQKYVVCDLHWMQRTEAELTRPEGKARTVLCTGRYVVLRLDAADTPAWLAVSFGL